MKIEHHRLITVRRDMPNDHALAIGGVKHDLLGLRQARLRGRGAQRLGKIQQRALREIHHRHDGEIDDHPDEQQYP